jgi:hypothetical protein
VAVVSITIPDKLDTDANAAFGGNQAKKDAIKAFLRNEVLNAKLRAANDAAAAALEAQRAAIIGADASEHGLGQPA